MARLAGVNTLLRFLLEFSLLLVLWAWYNNFAGKGQIILAIAPLLIIVFWRLCMILPSKFYLQDPWRLIMEIIIFGLAVLVLFSLGRSDLALILAVGVIVNIGLSFPLKQRPKPQLTA